MNLWNKHDLFVMDTRERMVLLKEEFDEKNGVNSENYHRRLNNFLDRKLKNQSKMIMQQQVFLSVFFLYSQYRKV